MPNTPHAPRIPCSFFGSAADAFPAPGVLDWPDGLDAFREVDGTPTPNAKDPGKDGPAWSPATYPAEVTRRSDAAVDALHALVLDYDSGTLDAEDTLARWGGFERVLHSTYKPGRWRVVIPYARPLTPAEHAAVYAWAVAREGALIDPSCRNPSRLFYLPTVRTDLDTEPVFGYEPGERLDPGALGLATIIQSPPSIDSTAMRGQSTGSPGARGAADAGIYEGIGVVRQDEDAALIESRCLFMARVHAEAASLPEPEWYAGLSILSRCRGGDDLAHEWSKPYAHYSWGETEAKYQRAKAVGPSTCAHIRALSPACTACPLSVTSPVQLGRNPAAAPAEEGEDPHARVKEAEARAEQARHAEADALVRAEQARKHLRVIRGERGASDDDIADAVRGVAAAQDAHREAERVRKGAEKALAAARKAVSVEGLPPEADPAVWQRMSHGKDGPKDTVANVLRVLGEDPRWASRLSYDAFSLDVCLDGRVLPEEQATVLTARLGDTYGLDTTTGRVIECARAVAVRRAFHPVRDWLESLAWDGTERIPEVLLRGFGAHVPPGCEDLLVRMSECFLVSMVARAMQPGAKVDTMLVLTGKQGAGKSTGLETLASQPWYSGSKIDLMGKDGYMNLRGKWLYEIAELEALKRAEAVTSKAWLSNRVDTYRAPYARRAEDHPRQTVLAGTTNEDEFLTDPTGHRRYHPVRVERVDLGWLGEYRGQVFAEALEMYRRGVTWWIPEGSALADKLAAYSAPYTTAHPWTERVVDWLHHHALRKRDVPFTVIDVLTSALMLDTKDIKQGEVVAVAGILRQVGCVRHGRSRAEGVYATTYSLPSSWPTREESKTLVLRTVSG